MTFNLTTLAAQSLRAFPIAVIAIASGCETPPPPDDGCAIGANEAFDAFVEAQSRGVLEFETVRANEFIVGVREGRFDDLQQFMASEGWDVGMTELSGGAWLMRFPGAAEDMPAYVDAMRAQTGMVTYIEPNRIYFPAQRIPNDPCFSFQWHYQDNEGGANLPVKWAENTGDANVVVAVLDTGIAANRDIAAANRAEGFDFVSDPAQARDGDGRDPDPTDPGDSFQSWHGTHVAGTIGVVATDNGQDVAGVAWRVRVSPVRVLGFEGGTTADIADAIRWAAGLSVPGAPDNPAPAQVINMSLGGPGRCGPTFQNAIDDAVAAGALVVVAAGNDASDAANFSPSGCDNVVTVAASDREGRLAFYSNFGAAVEIMAPGGDMRVDLDDDGVPDGVVSIVRGGVEGMNGTSMAAPHVAGVAALMLAEDASLTPDEIVRRLQENARPRDAAECPQPCGAGLLDADF